MKDFAVQPDPAHQTIHDERGARHVAGAFQQPDEEKQDQNLRQKNDHAAHAGDHAIGDQIAQIAWRHRVLDPVGRARRRGRRSQFIGYSASVKMLRNSSAMTAPSTSQPQTGCVTTASILSETVGPVVPGVQHDVGEQFCRSRRNASSTSVPAQSVPSPSHRCCQPRENFRRARAAAASSRRRARCPDRSATAAPRRAR